MKVLAMVLGLLASSLAFAGKSMLCQEVPGRSMGAFSFDLSSTADGEFDISHAQWGWGYVNTNILSCSIDTIRLDRKTSFKCIGYVTAFGSGRRTEIFVQLENGAGTAQVNHLDGDMFRTDGTILPCKVGGR